MKFLLTLTGLPKSKRFHYEKYFWRAQIPFVVYLAGWHPGLWDKISIVYVAALSIYALDLTAAGAESAAKAAEQTIENGES